MRVAFIISHPIQYYAPLFRELAARCELHVFYGQIISPAQQKTTGFDVAFSWDIDLLTGYDSTILRNVSKRPSPDRFFGCATPDIFEKLEAGNFDVLVSAGWYLFSHIQAIVAAKRLGIPVLVRGDSQLGTARSRAKEALKHVLFPRLLRALDGVLYVGQRNHEYFTHYKYPRSRMFFSPHCVENERFARASAIAEREPMRFALGLDAHTKVALFAGKLVDFKRPLDLLEAAAKARAAGLELQVVVAGSGPLESEMTRRSSELGVPLRILGFQNQTQMPAAYAAADVVCLPSSARETWGLVCNEALACGKPIIVSDAVGCAPDLAADGEVGRTFPMGDTDALAAALIDVSQRPPSAEAIRSRSDQYGLGPAARGILEAADFAIRRKRRSRAIGQAVRSPE